MLKAVGWWQLLVGLSLTGCVATVSGTSGAAQGVQPGAGQTTQPVATDGTVVKGAVRLTVSTDSMVMSAGKVQQAQGTVTYVDGSKDSNIAWSSSDSTIVTVNNDGRIQGVKAGVATVQAKAVADPARFANITVTVKAGVIDDVLARITPKGTQAIAVGGTVQLSATVQNSAGALGPNGTWRSSNVTVAKVSPSGLVTGVQPGKVTITFTSDADVTVKATTEVTVTPE